MNTTNILPERIPAIVKVMRESRKALGVLHQVNTLQDGTTSECFCVLGCIAEAYRREHPESHWEGKNGQTFYDGCSTNPSGYTLPLKVIQWARGIHVGSPCLNDIPLYRWNDDTQKSLNEIADMLESTLQP